MARRRGTQTRLEEIGVEAQETSREMTRLLAFGGEVARRGALRKARHLKRLAALEEQLIRSGSTTGKAA